MQAFEFFLIAIVLLIVGLLSAFNYWWMAPLLSLAIGWEITLSIALAILELISGCFVVVIGGDGL